VAGCVNGAELPRHDEIEVVGAVALAKDGLPLLSFQDLGPACELRDLIQCQREPLPTSPELVQCFNKLCIFLQSGVSHVASSYPQALGSIADLTIT
jgi:hypothetical protein